MLRKKKFQEQILSKIDGQLENLEIMVHDIEFAQIEIKIVDGLKEGNAALKKLHNILSIDEIEKVMDETREGIEKQRELDEILSGELTQEDEVEVEAELDALLNAEIKEASSEIVDEITLPEVPTDLPERRKGILLFLLYYRTLNNYTKSMYLIFCTNRTGKGKNARSNCFRSVKD